LHSSFNGVFRLLEQVSIVKLLMSQLGFELVLLELFSRFSGRLQLSFVVIRTLNQPGELDG